MDTRQSSYAEEKHVPPVRHRLWPVLALGILFLILLLLFLLVPDQKPRYYVEDEILLSGPLADVEAVVAALQRAPGEPVKISRTERLTLAFPIEDPARCSGVPPVLVEGQPYVVDRYHIEGGGDVRQAIKDLQDIIDAGHLAVQPEPNYLTGRPPDTAQADPWSIGGSPWSIGASPWSIGASPWCVGGSPWSIGPSPWSIGASPAGATVDTEAIDQFQGQWAFQSEGIDMPFSDVESASSGQGVLVGIFDTSPFPPTFSHASINSQPPLELDLFHPIVGGRHEATCDADDVRDHGLYSAGLVNAVAPASEIRLVRVLDDTGQGDLQTLNRALLAFITEVVARQGVGGEQVQQEAIQAEPLRGAVINLSLGVHPPADAAKQELPDDIASLRAVLSVAQCFNIVTVAAAGNDSAPPGPPLPPQIPAAWPSAIGVAASNKEDYLSCFSNEGQIMAPGGDGGPGTSACRSMLHTCEGDCPYALISLSLLSPTGYLYWHGTSFSAPLVSGWAAVLIGRNQTRGGGWLPQAEILKMMQDTGRPSTGPDPNIKIIDMGGNTP